MICIEYKDIKKTDICIDVRTKEEFNNMKLFKYNIPIINKVEHDLLKQRIYLAIPIIAKGLFKNKKLIKRDLKYYYETNNRNRFVIACSQGRLRSPFVYFYAKLLGYDAKILKYGIKPHFVKKKNDIKNLYGFLDI